MRELKDKSTTDIRDLNPDSSIARRATELRKLYISDYLRTKLSQSPYGLRSASEKAGIPYSTFNSILKNPLGAGINNVHKICAVLGIPIDMLSFLMDNILLFNDPDGPQGGFFIYSIDGLISEGHLGFAEHQYMVLRKTPLDYGLAYLETQYYERLTGYSTPPEMNELFESARDLSQDDIRAALQYINFLKSQAK